MVNVTKSNFLEQSNDFLEHLPTASFVALDEEMTGISTSERLTKDMTPEERWPQEKRVPEKYSIIQLGICLFHHDDTDCDDAKKADAGAAADDGAAAAAAEKESDGGNNDNDVRWRVRRYNFFMFPGATSGGSSAAPTSSTREVVLNPSTVAFLQEHNVSLDLWARQGIPYCHDDAAHEKIRSFIQREKRRQDEDNNGGGMVSPSSESTTTRGPATVQGTVQRCVELKRAEDIEFHATAMASLREWLDAPIPENGNNGNNGNNNNNNDGGDNNNGNNNNENEEQGQQQEGASFLLPACNSFLRRALYETVGQQYPSLILEPAGCGGGPSYANNNQIRVLRLSAAEKAARTARLQKEAWEAFVCRDLGLWRIWAALRGVAQGKCLERNHPAFAASVDQVDWTSTDMYGVAHHHHHHHHHQHQHHPYDDDSQRQQQQHQQNCSHCVPLVVHNGWMDLGFLSSHFWSPELPESYGTYKEALAKTFPVVYDTKMLSTEALAFANAASAAQRGSGADSSMEISNTRLGDLYRALVKSDARKAQSIRVVNNNNGTAGAAAEDQEHEAAYDAFMTGSVFLVLARHHLEAAADRRLTVQQMQEVWSPRINAEPNYSSSSNTTTGSSSTSNIARVFLSRNKLYQHCMYTADLQLPASEVDPLSFGMIPSATYRVSGFDSAVTTRDIVRCLTGLQDSAGRRVHFEIIWVDDTTFLAAASYKSAAAVVAPATATTAATTINSSHDDDTSSSTSANPFAWAERNMGTDTGNHAILAEHGALILARLKGRFLRSGDKKKTTTIVTLEAYLQKQRKQRQRRESLSFNKRKSSIHSGSWISHLWNIIGLGNNNNGNLTEESERHRQDKKSKRRRLH